MYIANGAGVNVPSESLGFYFGGYEPDYAGPIIFDQGTISPQESFIQVDMSDPAKAVWSTLSWPPSDLDVQPRANPELVWLPVSSQGVLVVIGGVTDSSELHTRQSSTTNETFMTSLPVYDIESKTWFVQKTQTPPKGFAPLPLTGFCAVVANSTDYTSRNPQFEIYIQGGYDGASGNSKSDVWVLSIPSFTWVHAYNDQSDTENSRSDHICVKPYPDQMFVVGGRSIYESSTAGCVTGIIDVFNLNGLSYQPTYQPWIWAEYSVNTSISSVVSQSPATGMDSKLAAILQAPYGTSFNSNVTYPYATAPKSGGPSWLPAVLGSVLGALALAIVIFAIWWFRRRRNRKSATSGTCRVEGWLGGVDKTDTSVATTEVEENPASPLAGYYEVSGDFKYRNARLPQTGVSEVDAGPTRRSPTSPRSPPAEADGSQMYEMHVLERGSPDAPVELATPYHDLASTPYSFRNHALYPLNPDGTSVSMSPTHAAASSAGHPSAPSPLGLHAQRIDDTNISVSQPASGSPVPSPAPDQSPPPAIPLEHRPSHKRNVSSLSDGVPNVSPPAGSPDLDAFERVGYGGLGYSNSRPGHTRNLSSMSSGLAQLPSPQEAVTPEEDQRRSQYISNLPSPTPRQDEGPFADPPPVVNQQVTLPQTEDGPGPATATSPVVGQQSSNGRSVARKQVPGRSVFKEEE